MGFILRTASPSICRLPGGCHHQLPLPRAMPGDPVSDHVLPGRRHDGTSCPPRPLKGHLRVRRSHHHPVFAYVKSVFTWDLGTSVRVGLPNRSPTCSVAPSRLDPVLVGTSTILSFHRLHRRHLRCLVPRTHGQHPLPAHPGDAGHSPWWWSPVALFLFGVSLAGCPSATPLQPGDHPLRFLGNTSRHRVARHHAGGHPGHGAGGVSSSPCATT